MNNKLWTRDFGLITLSNFFLFVSFQMLLPTLPVYAKTLGADEMVAGLIIGVFTISALVSRLYSGSAVDQRGRKGILVIGISIFVISATLYNFVISVLALLALRVLHGVGWGAATTASGTVAADVIPIERRGEGLSYYGMANTLSMAFAPALGLFIIGKYNFNYLFITSTMLALISLILVQAINYHPVIKNTVNIKKSVFERSSFRTASVLFFLTFLYGGVITFVALYARDLGIENAGIFFTVYALLVLLIRPIAGRVVDKRGTDIVVIPGLAITIIGLIILGLTQSYTGFIMSAVFIGLGFGSVMPSLQALTIMLAPPERRGAATATFFSALDIGIGLGAITLGALAKLVGYSSMYLISSISGFLGLLLYWLLIYGEKGGGMGNKRQRA